MNLTSTQMDSNAVPEPRATPAHELRPSTGAVVIGGDYRGLGIVRSLGRHHIPVWVLSDEHHLAAHSRYCRHSLPFPDSDDDDQERFLLELGHKHDLHGWALIPTGDEAAAFVSSRHQSLSAMYTLTTPPWDVFRWAYDKRLTNELADRCGVCRPKTWHPSNAEELASLDLKFPVILKPAFKTTLNAFTITKAWRVESREELLAKYDEATKCTEPEAVMVQEIVSGGGEAQLSFAALAVDGCPLASITAQRTRQYPMDFGRASTFVETIDDTEVESTAVRLLEMMNFTGLVEVEFKRDSRDHRLYLLDINPRVWGWHSLGRRAGVDFPYLLWRQAFGLEVIGTSSVPGVRWVRGLTDLPTVLKEIRTRRLSPLSYLRSIQPPIESAVLAVDDPYPAACEIPEAIAIALRRGELKSDLAPPDQQKHDQSAAAGWTSEALE